MAVIKQRFRGNRFSFSMNIFVFIVLLAVLFAAGYFVADYIDYDIFEDVGDCEPSEKVILEGNYTDCEELYNFTQEMMDDVNYWRNDAQDCGKKLWACGLILKQEQARG